ncbi:hypothetical protein AYI70_g10644 [Smittium culicis]|uniref:Uncharacterized protein n=1 Tax=Smittium culicis TaxID=133412 RepID=A0A1R1X5M6_9FUNG|nr:hypothetical protein AYI70_g10644 [Smittium culicis]
MEPHYGGRLAMKSGIWNPFHKPKILHGVIDVGKGAPAPYPRAESTDPPLKSNLNRFKLKLSWVPKKVLTDEMTALLSKREIEENQPREPGSYSQLFTLP